jgi:hypothetical protein
VRGFNAFIAVLVVSSSVASAAPIGTPFSTDMPVTNGAPVRTYFSTDPNPLSGLRGWHIDRPSTEATRHGISLDLDGAPVWDTFAIASTTPDLVLAYSHLTQSNMLVMRPDTGQVEIGPRVGRPVTESQVHITGGTPDAPLDGLGIGCYASRNGLYLYQKLPGLKRTKVNFCNLFQIGTDSQRNNSSDFFIGNNRTGRASLLISPSDWVTLGNGATIGGTFQHTGAAAGFFGAKPIGRPVITESRSNGKALASLLSQLAGLGLIVDRTTP